MNSFDDTKIYSDEELDELFGSPKASNSFKCIASALILLIAQEYSSPKTPLLQKDVEYLLKKKYGLSLERKAVSRHIHSLEDAGIGIHCTSKGAVWYDPADGDDIGLCA